MFPCKQRDKVQVSVSWPARLAGLRKRSEAECGACGVGFVGGQVVQHGNPASRKNSVLRVVFLY